MKKISKIIIFFILLFILTGCSNKNKEHFESNEYIDNQIVLNKSNGQSNQNYNTTKLSTEKSVDKEEEIGKYSTKIYDKENERQNNLEITCSKLNDTIVKSNEIFSFENTIGQATPEKGYQKAKIFDKEGNVKEGYGGGKCQVSTTLFNAVRNIEGIEVLERHNHSNTVPYAKSGDDAAVAHGGYDFKFKNNNKYDIKILASSDGENVNISINKL